MKEMVIFTLPKNIDSAIICDEYDDDQPYIIKRYYVPGEEESYLSIKPIVDDLELIKEIKEKKNENRKAKL